MDNLTGLSTASLLPCTFLSVAGRDCRGSIHSETVQELALTVPTAVVGLAVCKGRVDQGKIAPGKVDRDKAVVGKVDRDKVAPGRIVVEHSFWLEIDRADLPEHQYPLLCQWQRRCQKSGIRCPLPGLLLW